MVKSNNSLLYSVTIIKWLFIFISFSFFGILLYISHLTASNTWLASVYMSASFVFLGLVLSFIISLIPYIRRLVDKSYEDLVNEVNEKDLLNNLGIPRISKDWMNLKDELNKDIISLYECQIPTTYLGLLAEKNNNGLALIRPYTMYPVRNESRWGMMLESPGHLYQEYANSIKRFFVEGLERNYLRKIDRRQGEGSSSPLVDRERKSESGWAG